MSAKPEPVLWLDDHRGQYIPRDFANGIQHDYVRGVSEDDWEILSAGPEHELYDEVWSEVLDNAIVRSDNDILYTLYQDGDLWLIPIGMQWDDNEQFFVWPT